MSNTSKLILAVVLAISVGFNAGFLAKKPIVITQDGKTIYETRDSLAGVSSPDIQSPYFSVGGVREWFYQSNLGSASSTVCSFLSPAATTTLRAATARFDTIAAYATVWQWGVGTVPTATTTNLTTPFSIASGAAGNLIATTTLTSLVDGVIAPRTYVNLKVATGTVSSVFAPTGQCKVTFREI